MDEKTVNTKKQSLGKDVNFLKLFTKAILALHISIICQESL